MLDDETARSLVQFIFGGGALGLVAALGRVIYKWRTGRIREERIRNTDIVNQRLEAIEERKIAERERRAADRRANRALNEAARLRRLCIVNGVDPGPEPDFDDPPKTAATERRKQRGSTV